MARVKKDKAPERSKATKASAPVPEPVKPELLRAETLAATDHGGKADTLSSQ